MKDAGERSDLEAGMAKLFASETGKEVVEEAFRIHGGYGYSKEYEIERLYRDAPLLLIGEGTSEIQRMVIGKKLLRAEQGLSRVALVSGANRGIGARDRAPARRGSRLPRASPARATRTRSAARSRGSSPIRARRHRPGGGRRGAATGRVRSGPPGRPGQQRGRLRRSGRRRRLRPRRGPRGARGQHVRPLAADRRRCCRCCARATRRGSSTSRAAAGSSPT